MLDATQTDFDNIQIQSDELWATIHSTPEKCNNRHWQPKWTPELLHTKLAAVMRLTWKKKQKKQQQRWKKKKQQPNRFSFCFRSRSLNCNWCNRVACCLRLFRFIVYLLFASKPQWICNRFCSPNNQIHVLELVFIVYMLFQLRWIFLRLHFKFSISFYVRHFSVNFLHVV